MDKITVLILSSLLLATSPLLAQQVSPNNVDVPVRFGKINASVNIKNTKPVRTRFEFGVFNFKEIDGRQTPNINSVASNVQLSRQDLVMSPNAVVPIRLTINLEEDETFREVAFCVKETSVSTLTNKEDLDLRARVNQFVCSKVSGNRKEVNIRKIE